MRKALNQRMTLVTSLTLAISLFFLGFTPISQAEPTAATHSSSVEALPKLLNDLTRKRERRWKINGRLSSYDSPQSCSFLVTLRPLPSNTEITLEPERSDDLWACEWFQRGADDVSEVTKFLDFQPGLVNGKPVVSFGVLSLTAERSGSKKMRVTINSFKGFPTTGISESLEDVELPTVNVSPEVLATRDYYLPNIKGQFESSNEFDVRVAAIKLTQEIVSGANRRILYVDIGVDYNADTLQLKPSLGLGCTNLYGYFGENGEYERRSFRDITVSRAQSSKRDSGTNGFGAYWEWTETTVEEVIIRAECEDLAALNPIAFDRQRAAEAGEDFVTTLALRVAAQDPVSQRKMGTPKYGVSHIWSERNTLYYAQVLKAYLGDRKTGEVFAVFEF